MTDESQGSDSGQATDNENQEGSGSSHQGSDTDFQAPRDGSWVPRGRLNDVLAKLDGVSRELAEVKKGQEAANAPPQHTREELRTKVDAGELTQAAYDEYFARESEHRVVQQIGTDLDQRQKSATLSTELAAYEEAVPALKDTSSETYQRVAQEYAYALGTLGATEGPGTMVMAARSVLGPLSSLKARVPEANPVTHNETGGGAGESAAAGEKKPDLTWDKLTAREKDYYDRGIRAGAYADRAAALKELTDYKST